MALLVGGGDELGVEGCEGRMSGSWCCGRGGGGSGGSVKGDDGGGVAMCLRGL